MTKVEPGSWDFSDGDLAAVLDGAFSSPRTLGDGSQSEPPPVVPSQGVDWLEEDAADDMRLLVRTLAGQHVIAMGAFAANALSGTVKEAVCRQARAAADSLLRLAESSRDEQMQRLCSGLLTLIDRFGRGKARGMKRHRRELRRWVHKMAEALNNAAGEQLLRLVEYEDGSMPLLDELSNLRGIGPKRLESLYAAGLFTVDIVGEADPVEVAQVTGLPARLAIKVVATAAGYRRLLRLRYAESITADSRELADQLELAPSDVEPEVLAAARDAVTRLTEAIKAVEERESRA